MFAPTAQSSEGPEGLSATDRERRETKELLSWSDAMRLSAGAGRRGSEPKTDCPVAVLNGALSA